MALLHLTRPRAADRPYSHIAAFYDFLMAHVDYPAWARYVAGILEHRGLQRGDVLDIACGTGTLLFTLHELGYRVAGQDVSEAMIRVAREKDAERGTGIPFAVADMRRFTARDRDAIICLYDSLNYLLTPQDVHATLRQVYGALRPGGLFIFDVCTEANSLRNFHGVTDTGEWQGITYTRESTYRKRLRVQVNHFALRLPGGDGPVHEYHQQRIYTARELAGMVAATPFGLVHVYGEFTLRPPTPSSERVHYVLEKPSRAPAWPEEA